MTKELFDFMKHLDIQSAEVQLALRCAPLLAGLKCANLLILRKGQSCRIRHFVIHTNISGYLFYQSKEQEFLLLYRAGELEAHLSQPEAGRILGRMGYPDQSLCGLLDTFGKRYRAYRMGQGSFPHEMGLFLGYPPEDVQGFMEHQGENCLCAGYWKVYVHAAEKEVLFRKFDAAKERLVRMLAAGAHAEEMMESSIFIQKSIDGCDSSIVQ